MPAAPDRLSYLFEGIRRALNAAGRPSALLDAFGKHQAHAEAIVALGPAVRELNGAPPPA